MDDDNFSGADFAPASPEPAGEGAVVATPEPLAADTGTATTAPAAVQVEPRSTEGPIPFQTHKTALENARLKAAEEAWKGYESLKGVPPEQVQELLHWWQRASQDPDGFLLQAMQEHADPTAFLEKLVPWMQQHPEHSRRLTSLAAKQMASQRGQVEPQPDQQFQLEDGQIVRVYSPEQQAKRDAWLQQRMTSQLEQKFAPLFEQTEQAKKQQEAAQQEREITQFTQATLQDARTWHGMDSPETRVLVAQELEKIPVKGADPRDVSLALNAAWRSVLNTAILPQLGKAERSKVLQTIHQTAAANSINPAQTGTQAPKAMADMSIAEALQFAASQQQ